MHAPPALLIAAAVLGVAIPLGAGLFLQSTGNTAATWFVQVISLAAVPLLTARVAYRQGFEAGRDRQPSR